MGKSRGNMTRPSENALQQYELKGEQLQRTYPLGEETSQAQALLQAKTRARTRCNEQVPHSNEQSSVYSDCEELFVLPYFPRVPRSQTAKSSYSGNGRFCTS